MRILRRPTPTEPEQSMELLPTKIVGVGVNYRKHASEMGKELPEEPLIFLKPPSALVGTGETVYLPKGYNRIDHEAELGVVVGERITRRSPDEIAERILGFTCVNDVSVRDLQKSDGQWTRAKGFDTFCPIGPRIVGGIDPGKLTISAKVNGEVRQNSSTSDMVFSVYELLSFISFVMTLEPHDVVTTGTPEGVGPISDGDVVQVEISEIGVLENKVKG